jgi:hypothetical protein
MPQPVEQVSSFITCALYFSGVLNKSTTDFLAHRTAHDPYCLRSSCLLFMSVAPSAHAVFLDCLFDGDFEDPARPMRKPGSRTPKLRTRTVDPRPARRSRRSPESDHAGRPDAANTCFDVPSGLPYGENLYASRRM